MRHKPKQSKRRPRRRVNKELFRLVMAGRTWKFVLVSGLLFFKDAGDDSPRNTAAILRPELGEVHVASQVEDVDLMWGLGSIITQLIEETTRVITEQEAA